MADLPTPRLPAGVRRLFRWPFRRFRDIGRDVDEEVRFHLERRAEELVAAGMAPDTACEEALRRFGDVEDLQAFCREVERPAVIRSRVAAWVDDLAQDVRYAGRQVKRSPGLTAAIVAVLALGVAANASVFSLLDRLYLEAPPGVENPGAVRRVYQDMVSTFPSTAGQSSIYPFFGVSELEAIRTASAGDADVQGYFGPMLRGLRQGGDSAEVEYVTGGFFRMLGVHPARGRFFDSSEDRFGDPRRVAVLSYNYWQRHFASDPRIVGRELQLDSVTYTIVGVAQPGFAGVDLDAAEAWIPLAATPFVSGNGPPWFSGPGNFMLTLLARPKAGVAPRALGTRFTMGLRRADAGQRWFSPRSSVVTGRLVDPGGPAGVGPPDMQGLSLAQRLAILGLAVLLIAAANVASLLLMRALRRRREIAVRLALGVSRRRVVRQMVTEGLLLALVGCALALLVASWTGAVLRKTLLTDVRWTAAVVDGRVVVFAMAIAMGMAVVAGVAPVALTGGDTVAIALKAGAPQTGGPGSALRATLLVAQAALCMTLLAGAATLAQSLRRANTVDRGFGADRLISLVLFGRAPTTTEMSEAAGRVRELPGMQAAVAVFHFDLGAGGAHATVWTANGDSEAGAHLALVNFVDPAYIRTAGFRLIAGRGLTGADGPASEPVAVVTASLAKSLWPEGAVGQCLFDTRPGVCRRIVGVVANLRWDIGGPPVPLFLLPLSQAPPQVHAFALLVRTPSRAKARDVAAVLGALGGSLAGDGERLLVRRVSDMLAPQTRPLRVAATLFTLFGLLALLAAAAGIYGLVSYDANSRSRELAIRVALGATPDRLVREVVGGGLRVTVVGLAVGAGLALLGARVIASLLFRTSPYAMLPLTVAAGTLALAAAAASLLAARRATRLDPAAALNAE